MQIIEYRRRAVAALCILFLTVTFVGSVAAQTDFYNGKTIRIIVGLSSGGGYDRAARMMARQMGKYIPGNPSIVVQNMPGAGSVTAANYVWGVAKPDGLTILAPHNNLYLSQLSGQKEVKFDLTKTTVKNNKHRAATARCRDSIVCMEVLSLVISTIHL